MAAIADTKVMGGPQQSGRQGHAKSFPVWRWVILLAAAAYFFIPLWAALRFAGIGAFRSVLSQPGFASSLGLSARLAIITTVITIALDAADRRLRSPAATGGAPVWRLRRDRHRGRGRWLATRWLEGSGVRLENGVAVDAGCALNLRVRGG